MRCLYKTLENEREFANVRGRNSYGEYEVVFYPANFRIKPYVAYHSDNLEDACNTANAMIFPALPQDREAKYLDYFDAAVAAIR